MESLRQWKENFIKSQKRAEMHERRAMEAQRQMQVREREMMEWCKTQVAARERILSGQY